MNTVHVNYFAVLREQAGRRRETVETEAETLLDLYRDRARAHGFSLSPDRVRVAVDIDYVTMDTPVTDGLSVAFIPPVAGG
jgi:molybdopterin converting factor subunit 1